MAGDLERAALDALNEIREQSVGLSGVIHAARDRWRTASQARIQAAADEERALKDIRDGQAALEEYNAKTSARRAALRLLVGDTP